MISIWERDTFYRDTDILIAGGGLMGLWTARELLRQQPAIRITLAEALPVPALASTRNAGFACFGSPGELWHDLQTMGEEATWQVVHMRYSGIEKLRREFGDEIIGYEACGGFEVFAQQEDWIGDALREKLLMLNRGLEAITGMPAVYRDCTDALSIQGLEGFSAMAGNRIEGAIHSGRMVNALMHDLRHAGVVYLSAHRVLEATPQNGKVRVVLDAGGMQQVDISAGQLLWATNASLQNLPGLQKEVVPARGQVLLSPPIDGWRLQGTFHGEEGYYYFRHLGDRLLIGGARHKAFDAEQTLDGKPSGEIIHHLQEYIGRHIPQAAAVLAQPGWMQWAGIMGMSQPKTPLIQETVPGIWAAMACNGMGVALSPIVAEEVAAKLLGTGG